MRKRGLRRLSLGLLGIGVVCATIPSRAAIDEDRTRLLQSLGPLDTAQAVDVAPNGARAAVALPSAKPERSTIKIVAASGGDPASIDLAGRVVALLFDEDGSTLYGILHKSFKHGPGESVLLSVDTGTLKTTRDLVLPASARDLDLLPRRRMLLVACADEIRTFSVPALSSGALYRVPGANAALAALSGETLVLVGQADSLFFIDLAEAQAREGLTKQKSIALPGPIVDLSASPDISEARARLADGRAFRIDLEEWTLSEEEASPVLVRMRPPAGAHSPLVSEARVAPPAPVEVKTAKDDTEKGAAVAPTAEALPTAPPPKVEPLTPPSAPPPESAPSAAPPKVEAPAPPPNPPVLESRPSEAKPPAPASPPKAEPRVEAPAPDAPPTESPKIETPPVPPPSAPVSPPAPPPSAVTIPAPPPSGAAAFALSGKISGPAASQVVAVVLFGPNHVLHEATRVAPGPDGSWSVETLAPGRYRVVLDGGGHKVLVVEPSFLTIDVEPGSPVVAPELRVLRAL